MRPCDCHDMVSVMKLNEQGVGHNEWSIIVRPVSVILSNSTTEIKIPQNRFKQFAEWYLEDQEVG